MARGYDDTATIAEIERRMRAHPGLSRRQAILSVLAVDAGQASNLRRIELKMARKARALPGWVRDFLLASAVVPFFFIDMFILRDTPAVVVVTGIAMVAWSSVFVATAIGREGRGWIRSCIWVGLLAAFAFGLAWIDPSVMREESNSAMYAYALALIAGGLAGATYRLSERAGLAGLAGQFVTAGMLVLGLTPIWNVQDAFTKSQMAAVKAVAIYSRVDADMRKAGDRDPYRRWLLMRDLVLGLREAPFGKKYDIGRHVLDFELYHERMLKLEAAYRLCGQPKEEDRRFCDEVNAPTEPAFPPYPKLMPLKIAVFGAQVAEGM